MFDSSSYELGSDITIKCRVLVNGTTWYEDSYTVLAVNRAFLAGIDSLENVGSFSSAHASRQGTLAAKSILEPYFPVYRNVEQWGPPEYFLGLVSKNIHLFAGHSVTTAIFDGKHISPYTAAQGYFGNMIYFRNQEFEAPNVQDVRTAYMDGQLPPFSPGPSFNLTVIESCDDGKDEANPWIYMLPFWNGYGKYKEDQAVLGCKYFLLLDVYRKVSENLFPPLVDGYTITKARDDMVQYFVDHLENAVSDANGDRVPAQDDFRIFGDGSTTIRHAYDPNEAIRPISLWREIAEDTLT